MSINPSNAQPQAHSQQVYIHSEKVSFKAQVFQRLAGAFGTKKFIEKKLKRQSYEQVAAVLPGALKRTYQVTSENLGGRKVWTIAPKEKTSRHVILYLHGGAYHWNLSKYNWSFVENLIKETHATVIVPDYPLAPEFKAEQVYDFIEVLYQKILTLHEASAISIVGESAGGGLALGMAMRLRDKQLPPPRQLILLAPWLDITMSNPELQKVDPFDKILGIEGLQLAGKGYVGNLDVQDYRVSPIYGDLNNLPQISLFVGTHDLFVADSRKLKQKAIEQEVVLNYFEYPKMFHVWVLINNLREAKRARAQLVDLIVGSRLN